MLIRRCAWHRQFHGYALLHGIASWRGRSFAFSDGVCRGCAARVRAEWQIARPSILPPPSVPGAFPIGLRRLALGVGFALLVATVLPTRLVSDVMLGDPPEVLPAGTSMVGAAAPVAPATAASVVLGAAASEGRPRPLPARRVVTRPVAVRPAVTAAPAGAAVPARHAEPPRMAVAPVVQPAMASPFPHALVASVPASRPPAVRGASALDEDIARAVVRRASTRLLLAPPEDRPRHAGTVLQAP